MNPETLSFLGSLIVGVLSLCGIVYSSNSTRKVYEAVNDEKLKAISIQIEQLAKDQQKHNNLIERTYALENKDSIQDKNIEAIEKDVRDVKDDITGIKRDMYEVKESIHDIQINETKIVGKIDGK